MSNNSQSHSSQSSSRDCTPDPNHDYTATQKELIPLCTPSKSGNELAQLRSRLAASVDDHGRVVTRLKSRLDDLENQSNNPRKRGRRARNHRAKDDDIPSERRSFLKAALDDDYDPELRFTSDDDIRQGQLRELLDILPNDLETFRSLHGRHGQPTLQHGHSTPDSINPSKLATSESRLLHFRHLIGYSEEEKDYLLWDIPFLHANELPTLDFHELFRHPLLLKVFAALIRGPSGADGVMEGESKMPKANTMQKMLKIVYTTPGAIASSAIWVLWLFSGDETFAPVGDITAIDYQLRHDEYLDKILEGLRLKKRWAKELFVYWDSRLFPSMNGSRSGGGVQSKHEKQREQMERATDLLLEMTDASEDDEDGDGDGDLDDNQGGDNRGGDNQCEDSDE
ncbi:hypothetical protein C8J57DRAFT_1628896 [Mycena rebaudengoi]|nr:hypothetical protein C8J57DRAFT_1628896 [Mycena rebaudengoi]